MKQIKFNHPTVYPRLIVGVVLFFILGILTLSSLQYRPILDRDVFFNFVLLFYAAYFLAIAIYIYTFDPISKNKEYEKLLQTNNIRTVHDLSRLTDRKELVIIEDFKRLVKQGIVSEEIYDLIPSLREGYRPSEPSTQESNGQQGNRNSESSVVSEQYSAEKSSNSNSQPTYAIVHELEKLTTLHQSGHITDEEFRDAKNKIINR